MASEVRQTQQLDIPLFIHSIDGDALTLDGTGLSLPGLHSDDGLKAAYERLRKLNADEIDFQIRLIHGAMDARQLRPDTEAKYHPERVRIASNWIGVLTQGEPRAC